MEGAEFQTNQAQDRLHFPLSGQEKMVPGTGKKITIHGGCTEGGIQYLHIWSWTLNELLKLNLA